MKSTLIKYMIFTLLGVLGSPAGAVIDRTATIDYTPYLGPIRDQWDIKICFAMAAADALTMESGRPVSSMSVAIRYYQNRSGMEYVLLNPTAGLFQAGFADTVLKTSLDQVLCENGGMYGISEESNPALTNENIQKLVNSFNQYQSYMGPKAPVKLENSIIQLVGQLFPNLDSNVFRAEFKPGNNIINALGKFTSKQCSLKISSAHRKVVTTKNKNLMLRALDVALAEKKIPVIHYNVFPLKLETDRVGAFVSQFVGTHVSTIVGRRKIRNQIQYLLRNTWGFDTCQAYKPQYQANCNYGHLWIGENTLLRLMTSVSYIKNK